MLIKSIKVTCECENCGTIYTSTVQKYYGGPSVCPFCKEEWYIETKDIDVNFKKEGSTK